MKNPYFKITILLTLLCMLFWVISVNSQGEDDQPRPTPTPVGLPLPEYPETFEDVLTRLQNPHENCQLPCFWTIQPGYTTARDVLRLLEEDPVLPSTDGGNGIISLGYRFENDQRFSVSVRIIDGIATRTSISAHNPAPWLPEETLELPHFLSTMSSIPQAYIHMNITTWRFFVILAYDEGVFARYSFEVQGESFLRESQEPLLFCPVFYEHSSISIRLKNTDAESLLEEYAGITQDSPYKPWTVTDFTGLETEDFIQQIIDNPDECIEMLSYSELIEMGYDF